MLNLVQNHKINNLTKHVAVAYHHVRNLVEKGCFELLYVPTSGNLADMCTKSLARSLYQKLRELVMF